MGEWHLFHDGHLLIPMEEFKRYKGEKPFGEDRKKIVKKALELAMKHKLSRIISNMNPETRASVSQNAFKISDKELKAEIIYTFEGDTKNIWKELN